MARNLPIAFAAVIGGGVLLDAAIKGASISDVIRGQAQAAGGSVGAAGGLVGAGGAVNPFAQAQNVVVGRTDQGVDANLAPGSPILAPFAGTVTAINQNWYAGQPQIVMQGAAGSPFAGRFLYLAEQVTPGVHVGQSVAAGAPLGTYASTGTGIEMGWASDAQGTTLSTAQGSANAARAGQPNAAGSSFRAFLGSLGVKV